MLKKILFTALMLTLIISVIGYAQPQISGPQSGTLGPGTYLVVGNIRVNAGNTLTIVPGTTFLHNGNWKWEISGQMNAVGTETDSIFFIRQQPLEEHRWGGIRFLTGATTGSVLSYCVIDNCKHTTSTLGGGIYSTVDVQILHSRISNCYNYGEGAGIYITNCNATIQYCSITDNTAYNGTNGGGISIYGGNGTTISYNIIARNGATGT
jgi:hypothetical protein